MESIAPTVLFNGPWGSGKTRLLAEKAYYLCRRWPKYQACLVRKKRVDLKSTTWKWLIDKVIPPSVLEQSYYNKSELEIKFPNGSEIHGSGLIEGQKLGSKEYGFIGVEEAIEILKESEFNWIESRARDPGCPLHQVMYACNAGPPAHFLYKRFFMEKPRDPEGNPLTQLIEGEILWDILPASYRARLGMLKGRYRDRFVLNKWIGYEGLVYDCFRPGGDQAHLKPRFKIPPDWTYLIGIDFGFNTPFVFQMWAVSPDQRCYLDKEIYYSHRTINQHTPMIRQLMEERNLIEGPGNRFDNGKALRQFSIYTDHDSEDQATLEENLTDAKGRRLMTRKANKNVKAGIQKVYEMMDADQAIFFEDALVEKDPILMAMGKPTCTVDELQGYIWQNDSKDEPKKENDHGMDPMRYAFFSAFGPSKKEVVAQQISLGISVGTGPESGLESEPFQNKIPEDLEWINKYR